MGNGVEVGIGVAVGKGVTVGNGVDVGNGVAVGVDVALIGATVSTMITGAVAVGSAALVGAGVAVGRAARLGAGVAVGSEPGAGVGWITMTRGVGVAVADACRASVNCTVLPVRSVGPRFETALLAVDPKPIPSPLMSNANTTLVMTKYRRG